MKNARRTFERSVRIANDIFKSNGECRAFEMRRDEVHGMKMILESMGFSIQYDLYGDGYVLPGSDVRVLVKWSLCEEE